MHMKASNTGRSLSSPALCSPSCSLTTYIDRPSPGWLPWFLMRSDSHLLGYPDQQYVNMCVIVCVLKGGGETGAKQARQRETHRKTE